MEKKKYIDHCKLVTKAIRDVVNFVEKTDELKLIGNPKICVVAFTYKKNPSKIYHLDQALKSKGWHLSALQHPPALHISMVIGFSNRVRLFIKDLKECLELIKQTPEEYNQGGSIALYGTASKVPDSGLLNDTLNVVLDTFNK